MPETPLSPRHRIADELSAWIRAAALTASADGTVSRGEKAYTLAFAAGAPHYHYGDISVFSPGYLALVYQTGDAAFPSSERRVFRCARDLTLFVEALVAGDRAAADAIPLKPQRERK